jgi:hypothetical protein
VDAELGLKLVSQPAPPVRKRKNCHTQDKGKGHLQTTQYASSHDPIGLMELVLAIRFAAKGKAFQCHFGKIPSTEQWTLSDETRSCFR